MAEEPERVKIEIDDAELEEAIQRTEDALGKLRELKGAELDFTELDEALERVEELTSEEIDAQIAKAEELQGLIEELKDESTVALRATNMVLSKVPALREAVRLIRFIQFAERTDPLIMGLLLFLQIGGYFWAQIEMQRRREEERAKMEETYRRGHA